MKYQDLFSILAFLFLGITLFIFYSIIRWAIRNGITPMPTSPKVRKALLNHLPEQFSSPIYELGSGWGTLVFPLAKRFPHHQVIGYENSFIPFLYSLLRYQFQPYLNLSLIHQDFFSVSFQDAGLLVCYLYPGAMIMLKKKFENELKPGTWVISHTFAIPEWIPKWTFEVNDLYRTKIYAYQI